MHRSDRSNSFEAAVLYTGAPCRRVVLRRAVGFRQHLMSRHHFSSVTWSSPSIISQAELITIVPWRDVFANQPRICL